MESTTTITHYLRQAESSPCALTDLSTELILQIIEHVPPASHLDFACSCKRIAACSWDVLRRHRDAHEKYQVASDISPHTTITLLRSIFGYGDPIPAWHVRSFEIWYDRTSWEFWKPFKFDTPIDEDPTPTQFNGVEFMYHGEWDTYLERFEHIYQNITDVLLDYAHAALDSAHAALESGREAFLKAVLIAHLPRLNDLKLSVQTTNRQTVCPKDKTLSWLQELIVCGIRSSDWTLTPGLAGLRSVAVGVESGTWLEGNYPRSDDNYASSAVLAHLMRLPNIESIYVRNHESTDGDETDYTHTDWLPPGCSSLKHLWLDNAGNLNGSRWSPALFGAPPELLTVSFRRGDATLNDADTIVHDLNKYQGNSLQSLMFYDYEDAGSNNYRQGGISGYDCCAFLPESYGVCNALKHVCINVQDIELNASQSAYEGWEDEYSTEGGDDEDSDEEDADAAGVDETEASETGNEDLEDPNAPDDDNYDAEDSSTTAINSTFPRSFATPFFLRAFPYQMETLVLWGQPSNAYISWSPAVAVDDAPSPAADAHTMAAVEQAVIKLIKRAPNLKAIYLENTERRHDGPRTDRILYQEAASVGRKYGVDVHTGANREVLRVGVDGERVGEGWWREAPDKYDWKTGPWGERPREWRFDVYTGRRGPVGCGKCGECEACLGLYSRELWESIG